MTDDDPSIRTTRAGRIQGRCADGLCRFLGIPYAAPPVGENRFAEPRPVAPWPGLRDATRPGPNAFQKHRPFPRIDIAPLIGTGHEPGDDYLTLNIWAPEGARGRPVLLFIHGGAFMVGSKDAAIHDGSGFARSGLVSVAINYRLGIDGFLPIPGAPTNLGLRDMLAALRWVRDNIAAFGGDPANVTVAGESAGAMAIADLIASPLAAGLFRRAIVQSGHGSMVREVGIAQRVVRKLARLLKITPDIDGFRQVDNERGWRAIEKLSKPFTRLDLRDERGHEPLFGIAKLAPVYGDDVLPKHPLAALAAGAGRDVDLLIGTNAEEMNLYFVPSRVREKLPGFLARMMLRKSHPRAKDVLRSYGMGRRGMKPGAVFSDAMSDLVFRWPARQFAAAHQGRTNVYEFDWRSPACDGELGACHGVELPFVFDTLAQGSGADGIAGERPPQELADRIHRLWVDFATDGTLPWPEFDAKQRCVRLLASEMTVSEPPMPAATFLP